MDKKYIKKIDNGHNANNTLTIEYIKFYVIVGSSRTPTAHITQRLLNII